MAGQVITETELFTLLQELLKRFDELISRTRSIDQTLRTIERLLIGISSGGVL